MSKKNLLFGLVLVFIFLSGNIPPSFSETNSFTPTLVPGDPKLTEWQELPVVSDMSPEAMKIYERGLTLGNNPRRFTKIGDGGISTNWFLKIYDKDSNLYNLGSNKNLEKVIEYFSGSFDHDSQAAKRGFNTLMILDANYSDKKFCNANETPLDCEIRIYKPSFALITLGTNQFWQADIFSQKMRLIIERLIEKGVVPILSTKVDNLEGSHRINYIISEFSKEYRLPLWNFWRVCQDLPDFGLQKDKEHLTYISSYDFSDKETMKYAWPNRNLSALNVLEMLYLATLSEK